MQGNELSNNSPSYRMQQCSWLLKVDRDLTLPDLLKELAGFLVLVTTPRILLVTDNSVNHFFSISLVGKLAD
jgi:hypothetical protein